MKVERRRGEKGYNRHVKHKVSESGKVRGGDGKVKDGDV